MHFRVYACMYTCVYVCTHVCMHVYMNASILAGMLVCAAMHAWYATSRYACISRHACLVRVFVNVYACSRVRCLREQTVCVSVERV